MTREYITLGGGGAGLPLAVVEGGTISHVHADHLGTPQKMTDDTGAIVWDRQQRPFGETHSETGTATNPQRFPGQYADATTGLNYNYFRHYDPSLGRYIASDPIGLEGGLNTYGYVGGNPVNAVDPKGLETVTFGMDFSLPTFITKRINRDGIPVAGFSLGIGISLPTGEQSCGCSAPKFQFGGFLSATMGENVSSTLGSSSFELGFYRCNLTDLDGRGFEMQLNVPVPNPESPSPDGVGTSAKLDANNNYIGQTFQRGPGLNVSYGETLTKVLAIIK